MRRSLADDDAYCCGYGRGYRRGFAAGMKSGMKSARSAPADPEPAADPIIDRARVMLTLIDTARRAGARRLEWETPDGSVAVWRAS